MKPHDRERSRAKGAGTRGFTLLEVLVAVAILGLGLTVVSSAQTGVFWSYSRATRLSQAPGLARCKMGELELELLKLGFPLLDQNDEGDCCTDVDVPGYRCDWSIDTVKMPDLPTGSGTSDAGVAGGDPAAPGASSKGDGQASAGGGFGGPLAALGQIQQSGGGALGSGAGISDLSSMLGGAGGGGGGLGGGLGGGVASMVMSMVYPDLKPMLEASIRKLTVRVHWKEGAFERDLKVVQYITNPQHGGFDPLAAQGLGAANSAGGLLGGALPGAGGAMGLPGLPGLPGLGGAK